MRRGVAIEMEPLQGSFAFCYKAMAIEMKPLWGIVAMGVTSRCKAVAIEMKPLRGVGAGGWRQNIFGRRHNKKGFLQLT